MSETFNAPQSRNEAILQNMLGAENELPAPQSRIEELLQEILEQGGGDLYEHNITVSTKPTLTGRIIVATTTIISRSSTQIDLNGLYDYLTADPFETNKIKCASGSYFDVTNEKKYNVYGIRGSGIFLGFCYVNDNNIPTWFAENIANLTIEDAVVEI